jgi:HEAT repeats
MFRWNGILVLLLLSAAMQMGPQDVAAHRELFTAQEKEQLKVAERIELETVALTDQGTADASGITTTVTSRFTGLGYHVVIDPTQPHDVTVKVKCEEHKVWEGTVTSGGDADQLDPASRLWKGPACQITYRIPQHGTDWRHEVRTGPGKIPTGTEAITQLTGRLADDPFPILLAGAWGQSPRLMKLLEAPTTSQRHKIIIISLLGNMFAVEAIPILSDRLKEKDPAVARSAALALGAIGHEDCIPLLQELLKHDSPDLRLAAIKGLGRLAPLYPNSDIVPTLLAQLSHEPISTQTEIVRALGKTSDRRILEPLRALNRSVQEKTRSDSSPELKELKQALGQSLDQFDGTHSDE